MTGLIKYIRVAWLIAAILCLTECERRPLVDELPDTAKIPVVVYWDKADITPQNVTILIYREDGSLYEEKFFENGGASAKTAIFLETGTYTVVAFNEKRDQIDYVGIRGYGRLSTLEAYATEASSSYNTQGRANGETVVNQPGVLAAVDTVITVTDEMVSYSRGRITEDQLTDADAVKQALNSLNGLYPVRKTVEVNITVRISGLNNARMPALAELRNMAGGYFFGTDRNSTKPVTRQFLMNDRTYDEGSLTDGMLTATVRSFGFPGDREHPGSVPGTEIYLDVNFQLVDADRTMINLSSDVDGHMTVTTDGNGAITIAIDTYHGKLPDVKPEGSSEPGMSTELVDWDTVEIPIDL